MGNTLFEFPHVWVNVHIYVIFVYLFKGFKPTHCPHVYWSLSTMCRDKINFSSSTPETHKPSRKSDHSLCNAKQLHTVSERPVMEFTEAFHRTQIAAVIPLWSSRLYTCISGCISQLSEPQIQPIYYSCTAFFTRPQFLCHLCIERESDSIIRQHRLMDRLHFDFVLFISPGIGRGCWDLLCEFLNPEVSITTTDCSKKSALLLQMSLLVFVNLNCIRGSGKRSKF